MARTKIRGNTQIMDATITLGKLADNFIAGSTWNVDANNGATITGLAAPQNSHDAANKEYVDTMVSSTAKGPDGWDASSGSYPTQYKGADIVEGDPFVVTTEGDVNGEFYRVGDMIIAKVDNPSSADDWVSVQSNIDLATESTSGIIEIADQTETDDGTDNTRAITPLKLATYIDNKNLDVTAGNGLIKNGKAFDIVAGDNSIIVGTDDVKVRVNGASIVIDGDGVGLASNVTGTRTFTQAAGETFTFANNDADSVVLNTSPSGNVGSAIATVDYVNSKSANINAGDGLTKTTDSTTGEVTIDIASNDASIDVTADAIAVKIGNTNGTSLEVTATGLELASTITGERTFDDKVTMGDVDATGNVSLGSSTADSVTIVANPSGNVDLAVASVKYVNDEIAEAVGTPIYNEVPTVNAGTTDVTLNNTPKTGTQRVYLNGVRQVPGSGNDYTISGNTITFADSLAADDIVIVDYIY